MYWQDRFVQLKERLLDKGIDYYHNVSMQYDKAAANVQKEIDVFYQRFAKNNEMDLTDAKKLLNAKELKEFKWTVDEYIERGKTLNYTNEWAKQLENASLRYRISRLEALQLQMQQQVESVMGYEVDELDNMTRKIYEDGYYHSIFELQKGRGVGSSFAILDTDTINKVISKPWTSDGTNFSERVWGQHRPALIQSLNTDLVQALIRGDNPQNLTDKIAKEFNVAKYKANRLLYTEAAFFSETSQTDAFNELGVKYFSVCATLDKDTCGDCGDREGEKIPMSMCEDGVTSPPFHPNCRCTKLPIDDFGYTPRTRIARDENGKSYEVPGNMTYRQWKEEYVDNNLTKNDNGSIIKVNIKDTKEDNMNILPNIDQAIIPKEKFINYSLDPVRQPDKAIAFKNALGYTLDNYDELLENIRDNMANFKAVKKGDNGFGETYEVIMNLVGANGKKANVLTSWIIEKGKHYPRMTNAYVTKKKRGGRNDIT